MQVLLVNQNATIERLVSLSTGKLVYSLDKVSAATEAESKDYDFIIIDSDLYDAGELSTLKNSALGATVIMIVSKGFERPSGVDIFIEKPFLPTELVDILSTARVVEPIAESAGMDDLASLDDFDDNTKSDTASFEKEDSAVEVPDEINFDDDLDIASMDDVPDHGIDITTEEPDIGGADEEIVLDDIEVPYADEEVATDDTHASSSDDFVLEDAGETSDDLEDLNLDDLNLGDTALSLDSEDEDFVTKPALDDEMEIALPEDSVSLDDELEVTGGLGDELSFDDEMKIDNDTKTETDDLDELSLGDLSLDDDIEIPSEEIALDESDMPSDDLDELNIDVAPSGDEEIDLDAIHDEVSIDDSLDSVADTQDEVEDDEAEELKPVTSELLADFGDIDDALLNDSSTEYEDEITIGDDESVAPKPASSDDEDEEAPKVPSSIFGDDEVQKLKDLLGEDGEDLGGTAVADDGMEDLEPAGDVLDEQADEFDSMSEAGVAEALGMDYEQDVSDKVDTIDLEELPDIPSVPAVAKAQPSTQVEQLEISGSDLLSMPIERLKELLEASDITINITLKKKS